MQFDEILNFVAASIATSIALTFTYRATRLSTWATRVKDAAEIKTIVESAAIRGSASLSDGEQQSRREMIQKLDDDILFSSTIYLRKAGSTGYSAYLLWASFSYTAYFGGLAIYSELNRSQLEAAGDQMPISVPVFTALGLAFLLIGMVNLISRSRFIKDRKSAGLEVSTIPRELRAIFHHFRNKKIRRRLSQLSQRA